MKKAIKAFETRSGRSEHVNPFSTYEVSVERQLNLIMMGTPEHPAKEFTQCNSLRRILSYAFSEHRLDLHFVFKLAVIYTRGELQKSLKKAASCFASVSIGGIKRQVFARRVSTSNTAGDCLRQYIVHGKEKIYKLLLCNNEEIQSEIKRYGIGYKRRHKMGV